MLVFRGVVDVSFIVPFPVLNVIECDRIVARYIIYHHVGVSKNRGTKTQNGWFIMVPNPIKIDDLGVPLFLETPTCP